MRRGGKVSAESQRRGDEDGEGQEGAEGEGGGDGEGQEGAEGEGGAEAKRNGERKELKGWGEGAGGGRREGDGEEIEFCFILRRREGAGDLEGEGAGDREEMRRR